MAFGTQPDDAATVPISSVYSKESNTFPALQSEPGTYKDSFSNQSSAAMMSFLRPLIVQKAHNVTGSGAKTLTCAFAANNIAGNSIIVSMGMGEVDNGTTITLAITDTLANTYTSAVKASQSTTLEAAIFSATNIAAGANTITITIAGGSSSNTAIAVEIYEVWGLVAPTPLDLTGTGSNAGSTAPATGAMVPIVPNELIFAAIAAGGNTITPGTSWTLDSGTLSPSGGNLVSFGSQSQMLTTFASITPSATLSGSTAWAIAAASFKSVIVPIEGTVSLVAGSGVELVDSGGTNKASISAGGALKVDGSAVTQPVSGTVTANQGGTWTAVPNAATSGGSTASHAISAASTNATSVKGSAGQIYGFSISNTNASARYFKLFNKASAPTLGTDTPIMTVQVPGNGTVIRAFPVGLTLGTGIAYAATGALADLDTTVIGAGDLSLDLDYK
jgi:lipoprotein-anchoring transpeptidase ErfK/SrfK